MSRVNLRAEVDRQYRRLVEELGYHEAAGFAGTYSGELGTTISTLINWDFPKLIGETEEYEGDVPILLVVPERLVPLAQQAARVRLNGHGITLRQGMLMELHEARYEPRCDNGLHPALIEEPISELPYLLLDVRVSDACKIIEYDSPPRGRAYALQQQGSLLSAVEGIALATHFPERIPPYGMVMPKTLAGSMDVAAMGPGSAGETHFRLQRGTYDGLRRQSFHGNKPVGFCARRITRHVQKTRPQNS